MEAQHNFQPVNFSSSAIVSNSALAQNDGNNMDSLKMSGGGDDSTEEPNEGDELPNGEVLHCSFPGCMKGNIELCKYKIKINNYFFILRIYKSLVFDASHPHSYR